MADKPAWNNGKYFLTLVFASIFLVSLGTVSHNAFAMGDAPSTCTNRYDGKITSFVVSNGTYTFDAVTNPGATLDVDMQNTYSVLFVIHTSNSSSAGGNSSGTTWYDDAYGYQFGHCVPSRSTLSVGPNQDVSISRMLSHPANLPTYQEQVQIPVFNTFVNSISYSVSWKINSTSGSSSVPPVPQNLQANGDNMQVVLSWSAPSNNGGSPITNYKVYKSTSSGTETLFATIGNVTSYNDGTVTNGQKYFYKVTAVNSVGESSQSNEASATPVQSTNQVIATIPVGNSPFEIAVNPNTNKIYAADNYHDTVSVIDGSTNNVVTTFGSSSLGAIAINPNTNKIYVTDINSVGTVSVIDGATNQVMNKISVGYGPIGVAINSNTNTIYVSNHGSGSVSVINGTTNNVTNTISVGNHLPSFIALNPKTNMIYVVSNQAPATSGYSFSNDNTVSIINGTTNNVVGTVSVGVSPYGVAVNPNTNKIYVVDNGGNNGVFVIDGVTNSVSSSIQVGSSPVDIAINSNNNVIYVTNSGSNTVSVIDGSNNSILTTVPVGSQPYGVGINPDTNRIYVANSNSNSVSVIDGNSANTSTTPSAPQNLHSSAGNSQVTLSWTAPSSNGGSTIIGYNIYRGTTSGGESSTPIVTGITSTSYSDTTTTNGQTYFYKVTAVNSIGESASSNEASATPTAPATVSSAPTGLTASTISSSQINLSWTAPANNGGSTITGYMIERSNNTGTTWSIIQSNTGSAATTYSDSGLVPSTTYTYRVSAINSVGTSQPSNVSSATTSAVTPPPPTGIVLNNIQSTSGTVSSSNQMTLANFNTGTGNNKLLVVGISADSSDVNSITFNGISMTRKAGSFYNNDAEFWYLKNPSGAGNIVVTMNGQTSAVVGAYSFSGVNQTTPLPTSTTKHNTTPNSPNITITTKFANDWVLDLASIYGGSTLGSPTCTQQWDTNVPDAITGASSSKIVPTPGAVTCKWTASSGDLWDDAAVEIKASK